jgi:hypothetical protein
VPHLDIVSCSTGQTGRGWAHKMLHSNVQMLSYRKHMPACAAQEKKSIYSWENTSFGTGKRSMLMAHSFNFGKSALRYDSRESGEV